MRNHKMVGIIITYKEEKVLDRNLKANSTSLMKTFTFQQL